MGLFSCLMIGTVLIKMTAEDKDGPFESFWHPNVYGKHNLFSLTSCMDKSSSCEKKLSKETKFQREAIKGSGREQNSIG